MCHSSLPKMKSTSIKTKVDFSIFPFNMAFVKIYGMLLVPIKFHSIELVELVGIPRLTLVYRNYGMG